MQLYNARVEIPDIAGLIFGRFSCYFGYNYNAKKYLFSPIFRGRFRISNRKKKIEEKKVGLKLFVQHVKYSTLHSLTCNVDYKLTVQLNSDLSHDIASVIDITPCNKIIKHDKPLVVYRLVTKRNDA